MKKKKRSSVIFPFGAGTARCQVSQLSVFPLNPCGRLWLHVRDTWTYRGVFNHRSNGETFSVLFCCCWCCFVFVFVFLPPTGRVCFRWTGRGDENRFFAVLLWIICAPFFLWELNIETDSVEEVGWGKRLSRNPGNEEPLSSAPWRRLQHPVGTFTIKA